MRKRLPFLLFFTKKETKKLGKFNLRISIMLNKLFVYNFQKFPVLFRKKYLKISGEKKKIGRKKEMFSCSFFLWLLKVLVGFTKCFIRFGQSMSVYVCLYCMCVCVWVGESISVSTVAFFNKAQLKHWRPLTAQKIFRGDKRCTMQSLEKQVWSWNQEKTLNIYQILPSEGSSSLI